MARYTDAVCKLCRREGEKLFLKGAKCATDKCAIERKNYPPGQHGAGGRRVKPSEYSVQLREKQKIRRIYGILERQFENYFKKAAQKSGVTGTILLQMLETRLDNVVYRLGFASSRPLARQMVLHGHFEVDGKTVNIPSFQVRPGHEITVRDKSKKLNMIHDSLKKLREKNAMTWLEVDKAKLQGKLLELPERESIPINAKEQLVVELYSK